MPIAAREYKSKKYESIGEDGISLRIAHKSTRSHPLMHFDEKLGYERELGYSRNQKSIFVDEWKGRPTVDPIWMEEGGIIVEAENQTLQKFLEITPDNGVVFRLVDLAAIAEEEVNVMLRDNELMNQALELDIDQIQMIAKVILPRGSEKLSAKELKRDFYLKVAESPLSFQAAMKDPQIELHSLVTNFITAKLITFRNSKKEAWMNTTERKNKLVVFENLSVNKVGVISDFLISPEGTDDMKALEVCFNDLDE
tara:strand:+ start:2467 stop:3228 length:762 start_codon:yes stop_codon:yes gene_type:complete